MLSPEPVLRSRLVQWFAASAEAPEKSQEGRRARLIVASSLLLAAMASLMAANALWVAGGLTRTFWVLVLGILGLITAPILLRLTGRVRLPGAVVCGDLLLTVGILVGLNGGLSAPAALWLVPIPLVAAVLLGPRAALAGALVVCIEVFGYFSVERLGLLPAPEFTAAEMTGWRLAGLATSAAFVGLLATVLEWQDHSARQTLAARNQEIAHIVEGMPDGIAILQLGIMVYVNRAWAELLGREAASLVGQPLLQIVDPAHRGALASNLRKPTVDGDVWRGVRFLRQDGSPVVLELVPGTRLEFHGEQVQVFVGRDRSAEQRIRELERQRAADVRQVQSLLEQEIVARREAQHEAWVAAGEIHGLFEGAHDAILVFCPETEEILEANEQAAVLYGVPREQLVGRSLRDLSVTPQQGTEAIARILTEPGFHHLRTVHRRDDGAELHLDIIGSVIDYHGRVAILSNSRDVTERVRAEKLIRLREAEIRGEESSTSD